MLGSIKLGRHEVVVGAVVLVMALAVMQALLAVLVDEALESEMDCFAMLT